MNSPVSESLSKITLGFSVVVVMMVLALGTFLVSVWGDYGYQGGPENRPDQIEYLAGAGVEVRDLSEGISYVTDDSNELGILFEGGDLIRLLPNTEVVFDEVDLSSSPILLRAHLVSGEVWMSNLQDIMDIELSTDRVGIQPGNASTFVRLNDGEVTVFSAHHPTRVSFLSDEEPGVVLNDYLLTESHRVVIRESSLDASLGELRYTKLTKEYPFEFVEMAEWEKLWTTSLEADLDRLDEGFLVFSSELRRTGRVGSSEGSVFYRIGKGYKKLRSWLTFDKSYLSEVEASDDLDVLYQALYLISEDRDAEALERLNRFQTMVETFDSTENIENLIRIFRAVEWGNEFYPVKNLLRDIQLKAASPEDQRLMALEFLRDRLNEIYDVLDLGERSNAKAALADYNQEWTLFMNSSGSELVDLVQRLTEERQILQNLLFREDTFYSLDSYMVLGALEQRILNLTAQDFDLNEERLAFIQDKIRVLTHLVTLIDKKGVSVKEGVALGTRLLEDADVLMASVSQDVAVTEFFIQRLTELKQQFEFIKSPEFTLGEGSFEARLADYLAKESALDDLSAYVSGLAPVVPMAGESLSFEEALTEAETALRRAQIAFDSLSVIPRKDQDYRLFRIEGGHVGEIMFEGNYDRLSELVYDLSVNGEAFSSGVKVKNFVQVVTEALNAEFDRFGDVGDSDEVMVREVVLSPVEKLALELAIKNIEEATQLTLKSGAVTIVSLDDDLFNVVLDIPLRSGMVIVTFVYNMKSGEVSEVIAVRNMVTFSVEATSIQQLQTNVEAALLQYEADLATQSENSPL